MPTEKPSTDKSEQRGDDGALAGQQSGANQSKQAADNPAGEASEQRFDEKQGQNRLGSDPQRPQHGHLRAALSRVVESEHAQQQHGSGGDQRDQQFGEGRPLGSRSAARLALTSSSSASVPSVIVLRAFCRARTRVVKSTT